MLGFFFFLLQGKPAVCFHPQLSPYNNLDSSCAVVVLNQVTKIGHQKRKQTSSWSVYAHLVRGTKHEKRTERRRTCTSGPHLIAIDSVRLSSEIDLVAPCDVLSIMEKLVGSSRCSSAFFPSKAERMRPCPGVIQWICNWRTWRKRSPTIWIYCCLFSCLFSVLPSSLGGWTC